MDILDLVDFWTKLWIKNVDISRNSLVFGNVSVKIRVTSEDYIDSDGRMIQLVSQRGFLVLSIEIFSDLTSAWDQIKLVSIYS